MDFAGWQKQSLVDYPGKITTVLFTQGCNLRCPFCQNPSLVLPELFNRNASYPEKEIIEFLSARKGLLDALTVTGGEPLLQSELPKFLSQVKKLGFFIKLDTNGTLPEVLKKLVDLNVVDFVAMDVKALLVYERYREFTGDILTNPMFKNIHRSIDFLKEKGKEGLQVEFRTTLIKGRHSKEEIIEIGKALTGASCLALQSFRPGNILDSSWNKFSAYIEEELKALKSQLEKYVGKVVIR